MNYVPGLGRVDAQVSKRQVMEFRPEVSLDEPAMISRPFLKREVSKSRLIYPSGVEAAVRFGYLQHYLEQTLRYIKRCSLGKHAGEILAQRRYVISQLLASQGTSRKVFVSDDAEALMKVIHCPI